MNNKKLGTQFEKELCKILQSKGYWVHFISPNASGQQPFDVIALKNNKPLAIDCKTSVKPIFPLDRLEFNQVFAFEKWLQCGNTMPLVAIKYQNNVYMVEYGVLKEQGKIDLRTMEVWYECD